MLFQTSCFSPSGRFCAAGKELSGNGHSCSSHECYYGCVCDLLDPEFPATRCSRPSTFGSLCPTNILLTQAYSDQYHTIGWYQFCLGCIGKRWHTAVQALLPRSQPHQQLQWGSDLVYALWQFTKSLWHHCNAIVHGASTKESAQCLLLGL
jgi:hypothetical protein